jgi:hypothetical protein
MRGIDDPEFCCTQNVKNKSWTVRRRKFPLDQTQRHDAPITPAPKPEVAPVPEKPEAPADVKKDNLELSWANMQASANDGLSKQLAELSAKFEKISEKYEEAKKEKAKPKKPKPKVKLPPPPPQEEYEYYTDEEELIPPPPVRSSTVPQIPRQVPVGVYRRAGPISISQF